MGSSTGTTTASATAANPTRRPACARELVSTRSRSRSFQRWPDLAICLPQRLTCSRSSDANRTKNPAAPGMNTKAETPCWTVATGTVYIASSGSPASGARPRDTASRSTQIATAAMEIVRIREIPSVVGTGGPYLFEMSTPPENRSDSRVNTSAVGSTPKPAWAWA